jgi:tetratricopeptide (TPR) repeat protein
MDAAGRASNRRALIRIAIVLCLVISDGSSVLGQSGPGGAQNIAPAEQLVAERRWQDVVNLVQSVPAPSAELYFDYGTALAQLGRWEDARRAFRAGARLRPDDKRFPIELAGVAFKQKRYAEAATYLRRTLKLAPDDSYGNNFLGTVYFLEGNLDAALKYWNRIGKPQIAEVRTDPTPRVDPALLDHAFAFAPASTLKLSELLTTDVRIRGLGIFPSYRFDLLGRDDGKFDLVFRNQERDSWGRNKWERLFLLFRELPFQTVTPEFYNLGREATNIQSLFRWDAQKRRVLARVSAPFERNPKFRYGFIADLRSENWDIRDSFSGPAPLLGSLNLRREAVGVDFASFVSGRWRWSAGAEVSHRNFRSVIPGAALTPDLLAKGYQLKQMAQVDAELRRIPERRLTVEGAVSSQAGRIWSHPSHSFEKLQGSLRFHWFPQAEGDDYETQQQLRAGKTLGNVPFDELLMLGLEHDNDLWMRGHIGTRDGRKGSAPLGRNYFLSNWETDKNVYHNGLLTLKLGPFVDTGKITDSDPGLGSHKWLWDVGGQAKARLFGTGIVFSYGKDLRSGNNAFYLSMLR